MSVSPPAVEQRGKLDHIAIPVASWTVSRDWYVGTLGLEVEFEVPDARMVAVRDEHDFTIFLTQGSVPAHPDEFALYFQIDDVAQLFASLAERGVPFRHPPQKTPWGFGAELSDPDGYLIRLWDEASMGAAG
jgi:catechol 2,3-dioxygenase-like lactoylglutathione lyase family enzyme